MIYTYIYICKFSKKNLAYNDNNSIKRTVLNTCRSQKASRNRSLEISQQTAKANAKEAFQNKIISLKKETEDFKKERLTKSQILTRRQAMTSLISKPVPQKNSNNNSKNEEGVSRRTGDPQQQIQIKDVIKFIKKTMIILSDYLKRLRG